MAEDNKPNARAYTVRKGSAGGKGFWTRIGSAWLHKDGKGFNVQLDALPVDGRLVVRAITAKGETVDPDTGEVKDKGETLD
jgi:hypothetical protein